jgi:urease accessory protein UreF
VLINDEPMVAALRETFKQPVAGERNQIRLGSKADYGPVSVGFVAHVLQTNLARVGVMYSTDVSEMGALPRPAWIVRWRDGRKEWRARRTRDAVLSPCSGPYGRFSALMGWRLVQLLKSVKPHSQPWTLALVRRRLDLLRCL